MNGAVEVTNDVYAATSGDAGGGDRGSATMAAWESFVNGENTVHGVRPEILASWFRCRERYQVDPHLAQAPPAPCEGRHSLVHDTVFTELGGLAATAACDVQMLGGIITVADQDGRILASWGDRETLRVAEDANLAPWAAWPERTTGTNGMGTALECHEPVTVQGPEHWCQAFHDWACSGVAVRDVVTDEAIAVLNVSLLGAPMPARLTGWLRECSTIVQAGLRKRERRSGIELVAAFSDAASRIRGPVAALDAAGKVVIANENASLLLGVPAGTPAADPARRWAAHGTGLAGLAAHAASQAVRDPNWVGSTSVYVPVTDTLLPVSVHPVFQARQVIGLLITNEVADGDPASSLTAGPVTGPLSPTVPPPRPPEPGPLPGRLIARRDDRLVVLALPEIRYAESDGNTVWLATDQGRLRANAHGLDNLEHELENHGFLRVHRRFLVNLRRIREIDQGFKGSLFLITDVRVHEAVPVSRRHAPSLRRALGV
jgi:hypothetical protein